MVFLFIEKNLQLNDSDSVNFFGNIYSFASKVHAKTGTIGYFKY